MNSSLLYPKWELMLEALICYFIMNAELRGTIKAAEMQLSWKKHAKVICL